MTLEHSFIISLITFSAIALEAQTCEEQYEKYSQAIKKLAEVDSVYFELVKKGTVASLEYKPRILT